MTSAQQYDPTRVFHPEAPGCFRAKTQGANQRGLSLNTSLTLGFQSKSMKH